MSGNGGERIAGAAEGTRRHGLARRLFRLFLALAALAAAAVALLLAFAPGAVERGRNRVLPHAPYPVDAAAARLHAELFVADLHADTLMWRRSLLREAGRGHADLPRLRRGGVALQVFAAVTQVPKGLNYGRNDDDSDSLRLLTMVQGWPPSTWNSPYRRALHQAGKLDREVAGSGGSLRAIRSRADLEGLIREREAGGDAVGAVLAIEGLHALEGELAHVRTLYRAGYRIMAPTHFFDNAVGGSLHGAARGGLTPFGRQVVAELERLDIVIDLAHASEATVEDVLAMATRPVVVSHTGVRGTCDSPRNLRDGLLRRIADGGGLIGIGYWEGAVCDTTPRGVARAIAHAVRAFGAGHVALGSDFDGATTTRFDASELAALTQALLDEGLAPEVVAQVMGGNLRDFLLRHLPDATEPPP